MKKFIQLSVLAVASLVLSNAALSQELTGTLKKI